MFYPSSDLAAFSWRTVVPSVPLVIAGAIRLVRPLRFCLFLRSPANQVTLTWR